MKVKWKYGAILAALAAVLACPVYAFDYNQSVDEIGADPLTAYQTVYLGMPRGDFDLNFSVLPDWTFNGNETDKTESATRTVTQDKVTVTEGISIYSEGVGKKSRVLSFMNYFQTSDKRTAKSIYDRLAATIYSNMEDFPVYQTGKKISWTQNDVTIVVAFSDKKDAGGYYYATIYRYNNAVLDAVEAADISSH